MPLPRQTDEIFVTLCGMLLIKNPNLWASIDEILAVPEVNWVA